MQPKAVAALGITSLGCLQRRKHISYSVTAQVSGYDLSFYEGVSASHVRPLLACMHCLA